MNKKKANQTPDKKGTKKRLDHSEEEFDMWRKGEMDKEELAKKVHALMGNIDSDEPPIEFTSEDLEEFIIDSSPTNATPPQEKRVAKAMLAKPNALKATPKKTAPKPNTTANTTPSKTPKATPPRSAAKVSKKTEPSSPKKATTTPKAKASAKAVTAKPAKNNVPLASGTSTSKPRTAPKKTAGATKKTAAASKKTATAPKKTVAATKKTVAATRKTLAKSSKRAKAATLQDKKLTPKTKKVIAQHTAQNTSLALAQDGIDSSSNESKAVMPFYRRRNFQIGLGLLCVLIIVYVALAPQEPISKEIPIYEESRMGYYYREFTLKSTLDRYINLFDQKAWAVIQLERAGQDTTSAVKERQQAYQNLVEALREQDSTGEVTKDLQDRQAAIAKTLKK